MPWNPPKRGVFNILPLLKNIQSGPLPKMHIQMFSSYILLSFPETI